MVRHLGFLVSVFLLVSTQVSASPDYPDDYKGIRESFPQMTNAEVNAQVEEYLAENTLGMEWEVLLLILEDARRTWRNFRFRERMTHQWASVNERELNESILPWGAREALRPVWGATIPLGSLIFTKMLWAYPFATPEALWISLGGGLAAIPFGYGIANRRGVPQSIQDVSSGVRRTMVTSTVITYAAVGCAAVLRVMGMVP